MRHHLIRWIAAAGLLTVIAALTAATPTRWESFSLILVRDGSAWSATCEAGCAWTELGSRRPRLFGTSIVIDSYGIAGWLTPPDTSVAFAFRVTADGPAGWKATSLKGTAWTALAFECATSPCRARITGAGVEGVR
jgi:hypothetical protein